MDGAIPHRSKVAAEPRHIRFMTAGSVDDGKSTLIGRLLLDAGALMRDQAATIEGNPEGLAEVTDGLEAERAQGITIDVAYRSFETPEASFLIADAPGHVQYTRNMVTAASNSDVAVIVIDAAGVIGGALKAQTRRHAAVAALLGLDVIVAVNKMDLIDWSEVRFREIERALAELAASLKLGKITCVPISARRGDNVVRAGGAPWWHGPVLIDAITRSGARRIDEDDSALRLPVQTVLRDVQTRYYAGRVEHGVVRHGDRVLVGPQRQVATIKNVRVAGAIVPFAQAGAAVTIEFDDEHDVSRGDVIADPNVRYVRSFSADLCWLDETALVRGRRYVLRQGTLETQALVEDINFVHDISDFSQNTTATSLELNDIARVAMTTRDPIVGDIYTERPGTAAFALFDPQTNQTCGAGMIREVPV
jgi:sulfate adenylyltransferase subunit 1